MQRNFYLFSLSVSLSLTIVPPVKAARPVLLQEESFQNVQQKFHLSLPDGRRTLVAPNTLQFIREHTDNNQVTHIRMQQEYKGFLVYGGYAIIHSTAKAKNLLDSQTDMDISMDGTVYRDLQIELGNPAPDFIKNGGAALEKFEAQFQGKQLSEEEVIPIVYLDDNHKAHWAYKVSVYIHYEDRIPERPTAIVDDKLYKPFVQWNDIKTGLYAPVKGMGYGGNAKTGEYVYGKNYPLLEISRSDSNNTCYMENMAVKIVDMMHNSFTTNNPMEFNCGNDKKVGSNTFWTGYNNDGYDRENGAFSPSNDAMYSGYVITHLYHDWYNTAVLSKKGRPIQLIMRVHYGKGYDNAFWDGKQMTFGDGGPNSFPLVSLGISAHEISHGFTEQHSNLNYYGHSGGINESFSDMAAQAAEFYSNHTNNWVIGAEVMKNSDVIRYMDRPSRDGRSIDSATQYRPGLNVHYSSGVFNRLFYLIATTPGWDTRKAFDIMVKANMDYWTPNATFSEAGCGVVHAAYDLGMSGTVIKKALAKVGINYSFCSARKRLE